MVAPPRPVYREQSSNPDAHLGLLASDVGEYADVRLIDDSYFVCPWRTPVSTSNRSRSRR